MKITIVGAGAIGGYLGARLALAGEDVTFVARGPNLDALRSQGIRLIEEDGTERVAHPIRAVQSMADAGPQDYVLLTLKGHQVEQVAADMRALYGPDTAVVTMQNGIPWWYFHKLGGEYDGRPVTKADPKGIIAANVQRTRVASLRQLKRYDDALAALDDATAIFTAYAAGDRARSADLRGARALIHAAQGDAAGAHREAAEALAFDPTLAKCNAGDRDAIRRLAAAAD